MLTSQEKKHVFVDDYSSTSLRSATYDILRHFEEKDVKFDHNMALDTHLMNAKHWSSIVFNPNTTSSWKSVLEGYYNTDEYKAMNDKVHTDPKLGLLATMNFLDTIANATRTKKSQLPQNLQQNANTPQGFFNALNQQQQQQQNQQGGGGSQPTGQQQQQGAGVSAQDIMDEIIKELQKTAGDVSGMADTYDSFSHMGVPIERYEMDSIREVLASRIAINIAKIYRKMVNQPMGKNMTVPSPKRGVPIGVKTMRNFSEIPDILPSEFVDDDILSYKIATHTAQVRQRYSGTNDYVIYVDKSGSMGATMQFEGEWIERVAFSAGCAFALAKNMRKIGGKVMMKLFDTEVHDEITDYWQLIKVASTIKADGGTNITKVLEDALNYEDYRIVLASDGIDEITEQSARNASRLDLKVVLLDTKNPILEKYFKVQHVNELKGNFLLEA